MSPRTRVRSLSIYLLKDDVSVPDDAVKRHQSIGKLSIGRGRGTIGVLYHRTTPLRPPRWLEFFGSHVDPHAFQSSNVAAVLIVRAGGRFFAVAFGHGRHLLKLASYEEDFGLRVTLNSVNPDQIRTIDRKTLDATGRHSREQASRNIPIIEFGLDIDKDILRAVTGPPEDQALGRRLAGADALSVVTKVGLPDLKDRLEVYLGQYKKRSYRERFPWVDNIREVRNPTLSNHLDAELERRIRERQLERIWMAVPDLIDWHDVAGFTFSLAADAEYLDDISFDYYLGQVRHPDELSLETVRRGRVFCISAETDTPRAEWPVYKCIYAEIDRQGKTFLLNGGRWYQVASDYVREVDQAIQSIQESGTIQFPEYNDPNETAYNRRVQQMHRSTFALMDRRTVRYGGGRSRIEFCDLYSRRGEMVHVKRYGGSSSLSHLFAQGAVAATLFLNDHHFRRELNRVLPSSHRLGGVNSQPRASDYEVAYAIASKDKASLILPFFSRVTLRSTYQQLRNMGYQVTLTKIQAQ